MFKLLKRIAKSEKGQSIVEFGIVLPLLLIILGGIIDFGWIYTNQLTLDNCAREGARFAAINATDTNAVTLTQQRIMQTATDSIKKDITITVTYTNTAKKSAGDVIVSLKSRIPVLTPVVGVFVANQQIELSSSVTMKAE